MDGQVMFDAAEPRVSFMPAHDCIVIRIGYDVTFMVRDVDEAHRFVDQLQGAIREQTAHQSRQLARDETEIRSAATVREALQ
ncbi:hypothetical protein [Rhodococcus sp. H29-C3]|uniref:hypothetical protein n=1 Tax=Rhodococcus sp. H29-C3 TaxID=3046307 RepID=UPI0024B8D46B|nr:hypothetical protein [Rhodococcus sp. H29-C3]MDJ0359707.1 hypothetical protein [Rhodococcus sp. H29-C3]